MNSDPILNLDDLFIELFNPDAQIVCNFLEEDAGQHYHNAGTLIQNRVSLQGRTGALEVSFIYPSVLKHIRVLLYISLPYCYESLNVTENSIIFMWQIQSLSNLLS